MVRRFERSYSRFPVDLVSVNASCRFEAPASVVNVSRGGLKIQTGPSLVAGQLLNVFRGSQDIPFAHCRVVWSRTYGGALPSEAGLEILEIPPDAAFPARRVAAAAPREANLV